MDCRDNVSDTDDYHFEDEVMRFDSVAIIGGGESGVGAALLAQSRGKKVFVSEYGKLSDEYRTELKENKVPFEEGGHSLEELQKFDIIVKSPGVGDHTEVIKGLNYYDKTVISEIEFGFYFTEKRIIGVTGSNGKTTTTGLIYHLLREAGVTAVVGGNIGESFARQVSKEAEDTEVYVLELSSFQLDGIVDFLPNIAVLLNITPDHLDRYDYDFAKYEKAKWRIAMNQKEIDLLVYNSELKLQGGRQRRIAIEEKNYKSSKLLTKSGEIFEIEKSQLKGRHNRFNALCAIEVGLEYGLNRGQIQKGLESFVNVAHRLQEVAEVEGVVYVNDSKATNVDAVFYALEAMESSIIWIVGGSDKGNDYEAISSLVTEKVKHKIYLGIDNSKLLDYFGEGRESRSMVEAVQIASDLANAGDVVLLSPACASFDLFENYEDRGEQFVKAVMNLAT